MAEKIPTVLTIAGLDPSGYAGIIADVRTITALGAFSAGVITTLTNQTKDTFYEASPVPQSILFNQLERIFQTEEFDAIKIGMLYSKTNIDIIAEILKKYHPPNVVLDPVLTSSTGGILLEPDAVVLLKSRLIPLAEVITPNIPEAERLAEMTIASLEDMKKAGRLIFELGCKYVLVKGGHLPENANDILVYKDEAITLPGEYTKNTGFRGTGCVLSSAIAVFLTKGYDVPNAVLKAKRCLEYARQTAIQTKNGNRILNPLLKGE